MSAFRSNWIHISPTQVATSKGGYGSVCYFMEAFTATNLYRGRSSNTCDDITLNGTTLRVNCGNGKGGRVSTLISTNTILYINNTMLPSKHPYITTLAI